MIISTGYLDFGDNHGKQPLIYLDSTNMKTFDFTSRPSKTVTIVLNLFELLYNTCFALPYLNTSLLKPVTSFQAFLKISIYTPFMQNLRISLLNCKLVKNTFTKSGRSFPRALKRFSTFDA